MLKNKRANARRAANAARLFRAYSTFFCLLFSLAPFFLAHFLFFAQKKKCAPPF
jgi:hypothetical protein